MQRRRDKVGNSIRLQGRVRTLTRAVWALDNGILADESGPAYPHPNLLTRQFEAGLPFCGKVEPFRLTPVTPVSA